MAIPFLFARDWFKVAREPDLAKEMSKKTCLGDSGKGFRSATSFLLWKSPSDDTTLELLQPSSSFRGVGRKDHKADAAEPLSSLNY